MAQKRNGKAGRLTAAERDSNEVVHVRVPGEIMVQVREISKKEYRTISSCIVNLINQGIKDNKCAS